MPNREALFSIRGYSAIELSVDDIPTVQNFLESNPEYFYIAEGSPPTSNQAKEEFESELPQGWTYSKKWSIGIVRENGVMDAFATLVSDLFAPGVWHIGLFLLSTASHGHGLASQIYEELESWLHTSGAKWIRLGVIEGNARAERFWERNGYLEVRRRLNVQMKARSHTLRVMVKPIAQTGLATYFELVMRDCPESE
jgi:ribosomal protein S18 acetylase RimI-like enzyme